MKLTILTALSLLLALPLTGQQITNQPTGFTLGRVDFGIQPVDLNTRSSKFTEYRDVPDGGVLPFFRLFGDEALRYDLVGENVRQNDSRYWLLLGSEVFRLTIDYNQIPHRFGNDARTLFIPTAPGVLSIDDQIQRHCQTELENQWKISKPGINFAFLNGIMSQHLTTADTIDLGLIRKRGSLELRTPLGSPYDVRFTYFQENRTGDRAIGTSFGFSDAVESPEPIDYKTRQIGTSAEIPFSKGLIRGFVQYDDFNNRIASLTFDNPWRITDATDASAYAAPGAGSIGGASVGRLGLPPDNKSLTGSVGMALDLPSRSHLSADLSLSKWTQNSPFIPFTTNTAITAPFNATDISTLPERSLDGKMNVFAGTIAFSSRPTKNVSINARYRTYDADNQTRRIEFPGYVRFDAVWEPIERISVPYGVKTNRGDLSVAYNFGKATIEGAYRLEEWYRDFRETRKTTEGVWRLGGDFRPVDWALVRASYELGSRDYDQYVPERSGGASYVEEEFSNLPSLRRYDQAAKDIDRINALVQLTPFGTMSVTLNYFTTKDDYNKSQHGLILAKNSSWTAEADWTPLDRLNVYSFYSREALRSFQRGRQSGAKASTNPADDWTADVKDHVDSIGFGSTIGVVPDKLDFRVMSRYQLVNGRNDLFSPPGGTPDFAVPIDRFDDTKLWNTAAEFNYKLNPAWSVVVGGSVEKYWIRDAATTVLQNYMPGSLFLAANNGDYRGNVFYVRTSYRR